MSGFDANPFGDPVENNPFADPSVTQVTGQYSRVRSDLDDYNPFANQQVTTATQEPKVVPNVPQYQKPTPSNDLNSQPAMMKPVSEPPPAYSPVATQAVNTAELQRRQEELERKAAELQAKEDALRNATPFNARANNWPPLPTRFCVKPCFYQDIAVDIPLEFQKIVRAVYYLWLFYICVLALNFLGAITLMVGNQGATTFGFSILIMVLFVPLSFLCWFRPLYKAFRSDSSFNFMVFFFVFFIQCLIFVLYAIGIPSVGSCGFINGLNALSGASTAGAYAVGGISVVIGFLWTMAALMNAILLIKVHRIYRRTGASFSKAQEEFTTGVIRNEHVQSAATNVAVGAARSAAQQTFSGGQTNRY